MAGIQDLFTRIGEQLTMENISSFVLNIIAGFFENIPLIGPTIADWIRGLGGNPSAPSADAGDGTSTTTPAPDVAAQEAARASEFARNSDPSILEASRLAAIAPMPPEIRAYMPGGSRFGDLDEGGLKFSGDETHSRGASLVAMMDEVKREQWGGYVVTSWFDRDNTMIEAMGKGNLANEILKYNEEYRLFRGSVQDMQQNIAENPGLPPLPQEALLNVDATLQSRTEGAVYQVVANMSTMSAEQKTALTKLAESFGTTLEAMTERLKNTNQPDLVELSFATAALHIQDGSSEHKNALRDYRNAIDAQMKYFESGQYIEYLRAARQSAGIDEGAIATGNLRPTPTPDARISVEALGVRA